MAAYSLSAKAAADIDAIYEYTILSFGLAQARAYVMGLHERLGVLAENPSHGRNADDIATSLRRFAYGSHIVFYVAKTKGIRIVRVLHQSMDVKRHL